MIDPVDHHYIPKFYLRRWAIDDGELFCFKRSYGNKLAGKPVSPSGTGYIPHLYSMRIQDGVPDPLMEKNFMSLVDDEAAIALEILEKWLPENKWNTRNRNAWSRFIWSMQIRTPTAIAQLRSMVREPSEKITPGLKEAYDKVREEDGPDNVDDYLANLEPHEVDRIFRFLPKLMDNPRIGEFINSMHWKVIDFEQTGIPLMTSDRPAWMSPAFADPDPAIAMPIGPTRLFVATRDAGTMKRIKGQSRRQMAKEMNRSSVQHASLFVYTTQASVTPKTKAFIGKHFGTHPQADPLEKIAAKLGQRIVAQSDPQ